MNIDNILGASAYADGGRGAGGTAATKGESFEDILRAFKEEAAKTPADRARDEVLKKHDLSEEAYRKLPAEKRDPIDREIAEAVRRACAADRAGKVAQLF